MSWPWLVSNAAQPDLRILTDTSHRRRRSHLPAAHTICLSIVDGPALDQDLPERKRFIRSMAATCYFQLGDIADDYRPCGDDNGQTRHCCSRSHYCLSNGLCMVSDDLSIYRGACTSKEWDNDACTNICLKYSTHSGVWRCNDDTDGSGKQQWACDASGCGNSSEMFTIDKGDLQRNEKLSSAIDIQAVATTTVEVTAATVTGSCAATGNPSPSADAQQSGQAINATSCDEGISTGAAIGIGIGPAIPLLIALGAMSWLFWRERKRSKSHPKFMASNVGYENPDGPYGGYYNPEQKPAMAQTRNVSELGTEPGHNAAELDGNGRI